MFQVGPSLSQYGVVCAMRMSGVGLDFFLGEAWGGIIVVEHSVC